MIFGTCETCGGTLDAGEHRMCYECREKREKKQVRSQEMERMVTSTGYVQMEMEDFING